MAAIECVELTKMYEQRTALRDLSLTIERGQSFGLLGENGAGKSTFVRLLMGFIFPTSGQLQVLGKTKVAQAHTAIGYVHERTLFEPRISGRRYLVHLGRLAGVQGSVGLKHIDALLERVHLQDVAQRPVGSYSKGMQQRLAIAQALLTDPELLILDEPTSGLDPRSQWEIRQLIQGLRQEGKTILLCSHYLTEVEALCDTIGILRRGHMILSGAVSDLVSSKNVVEITIAEQLDARETLVRLEVPMQAILDTHGNTCKVRGESQAEILEKLVLAHVPLLSLQPLNQSLEEVYVQATEQADAAAIAQPAPVASGGK
ncbi:ABC transporter ATP-binding protein [Dictyobacter kobayashii]|uniref:ABC transporter n=1 Tax=Dictyobacter kobayashii TaxID=2014872 RepID=A0A402AQP8_9CHLR|nr:ABC transporter ATP-binding protein [Dictyobacter kobayashii]GCE21419.1 ABC transporter [Dictyobacter kobayashii]